MTQSPAALPARESPVTYTWFEAWKAALTRPSVATYTDLLLDPRASLGRAVAWLFVSALLAYLIGLAFQVLFFPGALAEIVQEAGETAPAGLKSVPGLLAGLSLACIPFLAAFAVASYLAGFGLVHFVASALGSQGSYTQVVYAHAAYIAPLSVLTTILGMVPLVNCLTLPLALYGFGLQLMALKASTRLSWGRVVAVLGILALIVTLMAVVLTLGLLAPELERWLESSGRVF
jgi:uncharacterized membrane protein